MSPKLRVADDSCLHLFRRSNFRGWQPLQLVTRLENARGKASRRQQADPQKTHISRLDERSSFEPILFETPEDRAQMNRMCGFQSLTNRHHLSSKNKKGKNRKLHALPNCCNRHPKKTKLNPSFYRHLPRQESSQPTPFRYLDDLVNFLPWFFLFTFKSLGVFGFAWGLRVTSIKESRDPHR